MIPLPFLKWEIKCVIPFKTARFINDNGRMHHIMTKVRQNDINCHTVQKLHSINSSASAPSKLFAKGFPFTIFQASLLIQPRYWTNNLIFIIYHFLRLGSLDGSDPVQGEEKSPKMALSWATKTNAVVTSFKLEMSRAWEERWKIYHDTS